MRRGDTGSDEKAWKKEREELMKMSVPELEAKLVELTKEKLIDAIQDVQYATHRIVADLLGKEIGISRSDWAGWSLVQDGSFARNEKLSKLLKQKAKKLLEDAESPEMDESLLAFTRTDAYKRKFSKAYRDAFAEFLQESLHERAENLARERAGKLLAQMSEQEPSDV